MSLIKNRRNASFRKVPFHRDTTSHSQEKNTQENNAPLLKSVPQTKNVSTKEKKYSIEGYVIGENYQYLRDRLIDALENEEKGELVDPTYGVLQVIPLGFSVSESKEEEGKAVFSMEFKLHKDLAPPKSEIESSKKIESLAEEIAVENRSDFAGKFSTENSPQFVKDSAISNIEGAIENYESAIVSVKKAGSAASSVLHKAKNMKSQLTQLIESPLSLAENLQGVYDDFKNADLGSDDLFDAYKKQDEYSSSLTPVNPTTVSRQKQKDNQEATEKFLNTDTMVNQCVAASKMMENSLIDSRSDAKAIRKELISKIDKLLESEDNSVLYLKLTELRSEISNALPGKSESVSDYSTFTPINTVSSLVLAYDIFENPEKEESIIRRNSIVHPGFIPGGEELEILNEN